MRRDDLDRRVCSRILHIELRQGWADRPHKDIAPPGCNVEADDQWLARAWPVRVRMRSRSAHRRPTTGRNSGSHLEKLNQPRSFRPQRPDSSQRRQVRLWMSASASLWSDRSLHMCRCLCQLLGSSSLCCWTRGPALRNAPSPLCRRCRPGQTRSPGCSSRDNRSNSWSRRRSFRRWFQAPGRKQSSRPVPQVISVSFAGSVWIWVGCLYAPGRHPDSQDPYHGSDRCGPPASECDFLSPSGQTTQFFGPDSRCCRGA